MRELDDKLKYEILKTMAETDKNASHNSRDLIDLMVSRGWEEQKVVEHLVEMWRQKLFDLTPDPGIFLD